MTKPRAAVALVGLSSAEERIVRSVIDRELEMADLEPVFLRSSDDGSPLADIELQADQRGKARFAFCVVWVVKEAVREQEPPRFWVGYSYNGQSERHLTEPNSDALESLRVAGAAAGESAVMAACIEHSRIGKEAHQFGAAIKRAAAIAGSTSGGDWALTGAGIECVLSVTPSNAKRMQLLDSWMANPNLQDPVVQARLGLFNALLHERAELPCDCGRSIKEMGVQALTLVTAEYAFDDSLEHRSEILREMADAAGIAWRHGARPRQVAELLSPVLARERDSIKFDPCEDSPRVDLLRTGYRCTFMMGGAGHADVFERSQSACDAYALREADIAFAIATAYATQDMELAAILQDRIALLIGRTPGLVGPLQAMMKFIVPASPEEYATRVEELESYRVRWADDALTGYILASELNDADVHLSEAADSYSVANGVELRGSTLLVFRAAEAIVALFEERIDDARAQIDIIERSREGGEICRKVSGYCDLIESDGAQAGVLDFMRTPSDGWRLFNNALPVMRTRIRRQICGALVIRRAEGKLSLGNAEGTLLDVCDSWLALN